MVCDRGLSFLSRHRVATGWKIVGVATENPFPKVDLRDSARRRSVAVPYVVIVGNRRSGEVSAEGLWTRWPPTKKGSGIVAEALHARRHDFAGRTSRPRKQIPAHHRREHGANPPSCRAGAVRHY